MPDDSKNEPGRVRAMTGAGLKQIKNKDVFNKKIRMANFILKE